MERIDDETRFPGGNLNQAIAIVRLTEAVNPRFLASFLLSSDGQYQLHRQKKEIARANLSLQDIRNLVVPKPLIHEQREIACMLSAADRKIEAEGQRKAALQELFKSMLHQLMTGRVRLKDAGFEG